jgi:hypothetical protein
MWKYGALAAIGAVSGLLTDVVFGHAARAEPRLGLFGGVVFAAAMVLYAVIAEGFRSVPRLLGFFVICGAGFAVAIVSVALMFVAGSSITEALYVFVGAEAPYFIGCFFGTMTVFLARYFLLGQAMDWSVLWRRLALVGVLGGIVGAGAFAADMKYEQMKLQGKYAAAREWKESDLKDAKKRGVDWIFLVWQGVMLPVFVWAVPVREMEEGRGLGAEVLSHRSE